MNQLLLFGLIFGIGGAFGMLLEEGLSAFRHPLDVRGEGPSFEPIKRVFAHVSFALGVAALVLWLALFILGLA